MSLHFTKNLIIAESCTIFLVLLFSLFSDFPKKEDLAGIAIDRACKFKLLAALRYLHSHIKY